MRLVDLDNHQLAQVARLLLRRWLDRQTGRRPPEQVAALLAVGAQTVDLPTVPQHPVRERDLDPVVALRLDHDRAYATGILRTADGHSTVAVEFTDTAGQVRITRIGPHGHDPSTAIAPPPAPSHLTGLLGPLPQSAEAGRSWLAGAAVIEAYRDRHHIRDHTTTLGPTPDQPWPRAERQRAVTHLADVQRQLRELEPERQFGARRGDEGRGLLR